MAKWLVPLCIALFMEYDTVTLPDHLREGCDKGGRWQLKNARFRRAVCDYLQLQWVSCSGDGNCFFESVCMLLRSVGIQPDLTAPQLRANVVQYLRLCPLSTQDLPERICTEMLDELSEPLVCSNHGRFNGFRLNGFVPTSIAEYIDASACDNVWVRGLHWLRAISYLHEVRVGVVIYGQLIVRYIGAGEKTIHLYKVDAETHWDPLLPVAYAPPSFQPLTGSSAPPQAALSSSDDDDDEHEVVTNADELQSQAQASDAPAPAPDGPAPAPTVIISSSSSESDVSPLPKQPPATALQGVHSSSRRRRIKCETHISSSSDSDVESFDAANSTHAKDQLLDMLSRCHVNGHFRCINSRAHYVYCKCSICGCTAAVKQSKVDPKRWVVSAVSQTARHPCSGSPAPAPLLAIPSPSVDPVLRLLQLPSVSVIPAVPTATCCSCQDQCQPDVMFKCPNPSAHLLCPECFEGNVSSQFGEDILKFINNNCAIFCSFCSSSNRETTPYNMQALIPR